MSGIDDFDSEEDHVVDMKRTSSIDDYNANIIASLKKPARLIDDKVITKPSYSKPDLTLVSSNNMTSILSSPSNRQSKPPISSTSVLATTGKTYSQPPASNIKSDKRPTVNSVKPPMVKSVELGDAVWIVNLRGGSATKHKVDEITDRYVVTDNNVRLAKDKLTKTIEANTWRYEL